MIFQPLETKRLLLKNICKEDTHFMLKQFSDPTINQYLFDAEPLKTKEDAMHLIDFYINQANSFFHRYILILKSTGEKIGTCGFHAYQAKEHSIEIGYDLQKSHWHQGYMYEAIDAMLKYIINDLKIRTIHACIYIDNLASKRLVERFSFSQTKAIDLDFRDKKYRHHIYTLKTPATF